MKRRHGIEMKIETGAKVNDIQHPVRSRSNEKGPEILDVEGGVEKYKANRGVQFVPAGFASPRTYNRHVNHWVVPKSSTRAL